MALLPISPDCKSDSMTLAPCYLSLHCPHTVVLLAGSDCHCTGHQGGSVRQNNINIITLHMGDAYHISKVRNEGIINNNNTNIIITSYAISPISPPRTGAQLKLIGWR